MEKATRKKKLGGYPAIGVVTSITLALFVIGLFGLLLSYSNQFEKLVRENISFKVYLKGTLSDTQRAQVQQNLQSKEFVAKTGRPITFTSKEDAEKDLGNIGNFKEILGDNPLKDMFDVKIDPAFHDTLSLNNIKVELENMSGVLEAIYEKNLLDDINTNFTRISLVLIGITAILLLTVIFLINSTLRLALFSQRFLIRSMQLVGARRGFIQRPFLLRAAFYGLIAGGIACGILTLLTNYAYKKVDSLLLLYDKNQYMILMGAITATGILIAVMSTFFSMRRYLKMSLDELY